MYSNTQMRTQVVDNYGVGKNYPTVNQKLTTSKPIW
jgi:hypothetical protein